MTKKRYIKLCYALMQKIGREMPIAKMGILLKGVQRIDFKNITYSSYAEAWESLKSIRSQYGM